MKAISTHKRGSSRLGGIYLLELTTIILLLTIVVLAASTITVHSQLLFEEQVESYEVDRIGWRVLERLNTEFRQVLPRSILPAVLEGSDTIRFRKVTGYVGDAQQLGPVNVIRFELAPGEVANGVDDNGDGRVDEGRITHREGATAPAVVAENILDFRLHSTASGIEYSVETGLVRRRGNVLRRTYTQEVSFRF